MSRHFNMPPSGILDLKLRLMFVGNVSPPARYLSDRCRKWSVAYAFIQIIRLYRIALRISRRKTPRET